MRYIYRMQQSVRYATRNGNERWTHSTCVTIVLILLFLVLLLLLFIALVLLIRPSLLFLWSRSAARRGSSLCSLHLARSITARPFTCKQMQMSSSAFVPYHRGAQVPSSPPTRASLHQAALPSGVQFSQNNSSSGDPASPDRPHDVDTSSYGQDSNTTNDQRFKRLSKQLQR